MAFDQAGLRVVIAERHRMVAESLARIISAYGGTEVVAQVSDSSSLLEATQKAAPDVAFMDIDLDPDSSVVPELKRVSPETRVIVLADRAEADPDGLVRALTSGAVGAVYREASIEELQRALRFSSASTPVVADEATGLLLSSYLDVLTDKRCRDLATIEALAGALEVRDVTTGHHLHRVTEIAHACIERVDPQLASNEEVGFGFTLHDVGKIGVPDSILNKPGPLTAGEWEVMRRHPELGLKIVQPIGFSNAATDIILWHHEHWDGRGYPNGLRGQEIPMTARAFAVADAYDAMTSERPYRSAMSTAEALEVISDEAGKRYDPYLVQEFLDLVGDRGRPL